MFARKRQGDEGKSFNKRATPQSQLDLLKDSGRGWVHPSPGVAEMFGCPWVPLGVPAEGKQVTY